MNEVPEDMWSPYKHLYRVIESSISSKSQIPLTELENSLRKHKQTFINILRNPPKNENSRAQLKQGISDGINIPGHGHMLLSKELVDESIIISDMFDLDEFVALELLCTSQRQMIQHPGLPRGLVAILLYYDGRKALAYALRDIFQATSGACWCTEAPKEVTYLISNFTQTIVEESNILIRIMEVLENLDISNELNLLNKNRALGPPKHRRQILDLFEDIRLALATALYNWSAQRGLPKNVVKKLLEYLAKYKPTESTGNMDDVSFTLLMAMLYTIDTSVTQRQEDTEKSVQSLLIVKEVGYAQAIHDILQADNNWEWDNKLKSIVTFAFGLALASLRHTPQNIQAAVACIIDRDEQLVDEAIAMRVFDFIHYYVLSRDILYKSEFFNRRIHYIFTDFIDFMHSKVTELRGRADETARTVQGFAKEGLDPPNNLDHNFELLMLSIAKFYEDNRSGLSLSVEYWGPMDKPANYNKTSARSVSLFKFIRLAGELLPPILFVPYLKMLAGLSSCEESARNTFNLLKQGWGLSNSATLSWDHFFSSVSRYHSILRQEQYAGSDTIYRSHVLNRSINPQEIEGLHAVLNVIRAVATHDEMARIALSELPSWSSLTVLIGLVTCSIPIDLKADLLLTLAALGKSKSIALLLWNKLEASHAIVTIPTTSSYVICGLEADIEQNEARNETYPLTQAALELFYSLASTAIPKNLGAGPRKPGLDPYLTFIIDTVFLKFYNRSYKNPAEKWDVGVKCLRLLYHFLKIYEINPSDFAELRTENPPPGYHIMLQLQTKSDSLRLLLNIIDEARNNLDQYQPFPGKAQMEECVLYCLKIIEFGLKNQDLYFDAHSAASCSTLLSGLNKILLDINPQSGKPDHMLNTTKFVTYSSWLPRHALVAVNILRIVSRLPNVGSQILGIFSQSERTQIEIRHGFVEGLEGDIPTFLEEDIDDEDDLKIDLQMKEAIITLIQDNLQRPAPNIAHFLLGLDLPREARNVSTCLKSLLYILDKHLEIIKGDAEYTNSYEGLIEKAYNLLYSLCFNQRTSEVVLRFLRSNSDFLCRHLAALPLRQCHSFHVIYQISNLLKCIAIELKITAANNQISRFQHMGEILYGSSGNSAQESIPLELSHYYSNSLSEVCSDKGNRMLICNMLDNHEFEAKVLTPPVWDCFDNSLIPKLFEQCEVHSDRCPKLVDIKKVHNILNEDLLTVRSAVAAGQLQLIQKEIESVMSFAVKVNEMRYRNYATVQFMEAWGQVTEVLFTCAPAAALPIEVKQNLIIEVVQSLLSKTVPKQIVSELANITSGTVLMLLVNLRYCYIQKNTIQLNNTEDVNDSRQLSNITANTKAALTLSQPNTLSLKFILKHVLEWIIISGVNSQKLRVNLYASILHFMYIVKDNSFSPTKHNENHEHYVSRLDRSMVHCLDESPHPNASSQIQMTAEILVSYGYKLIDIMCRDSIDSHDICKMSALSCINAILELDSLTHLLNFISKRGYLSYLIRTLTDSDEMLCLVLRTTPQNMRTLYVYESKMAMLTRVASSYIGAELLLESKLLEVLAGMKVLDMHPDSQINVISTEKYMDSFVPSVEARYQQILFPALNLCDAIISTFGPENHSAISQVINFLLSHGDMVEIILRAGTPFVELNLMHELSMVTGLIARTTNQEIRALSNPNQNPEISVYLFRIQRLMLALLPRFKITGATFKEFLKLQPPTQEQTEQSHALREQYFLEIAANLALYCRNAISNHATDHKANTVLFSPNLKDSVHKSENVNGSLEIAPSLGIIIDQLKGSVDHFKNKKTMFNNLLRQRSSLSNIGIDSSVPSNFAEISEQLRLQTNESQLCALIIEHCLYLLWIHLDFYMNPAMLRTTAKAPPTNNSNGSLYNGSKWQINGDDVSALKKTLVLVFNETFSTELLSTSQWESSSDKGFTSALLRRIKALIQFVPDKDKSIMCP